MLSLESIVGTAAAICSTLSNVPQLKKVWTTRETADISLKMLLLLATGLSLWVVYGVIRSDIVIVAANLISLMLLACIIYFKLREKNESGAAD